MSLLWRPLFRAMVTILGVVIVAVLCDSGFIYWQATRGKKLPFKLNLIPRVGSELG